MEKVMLSLKDVHRLRQSLEMNSSIRDSLACSHDDDSDSSDAGFSPSEETIEEVDEMSHVDVNKSTNLKSSQSASHVDNSDDVMRSSESSVSKPHLLTLNANDVVVLEFSAPSEENSSSSTPSGQSRTPREERAKNRAEQANLEDARVRKSRELMLRPERNEPVDKSPRESRKSRDVKVSVAVGNVRASGEESRMSKERLRTDVSVEMSHAVKASRRSVVITDSAVCDAADPKIHNAQATEGPGSDSVSVGISAGNMDSIVEKVLRLDVKGQRHLLKILAQIEQGAGSTTVYNDFNYGL